ncbi:hypothetical protein AAAC10_17225 [Pseudomonas aeruginosa]|uniref:hypothetical protein n=1 Tax=Pseudomonas aeruginosa TaxID=287 RepID=UPI0030F36C63
MLDLQAAQFVAAKGAPEADQQQCAITPAAQQLRQVALVQCFLARPLQPRHALLQFAQLQRFGLLLRLRVQGTNALEDLTNQRGLGRIREALADMPLRQGRQAQLEGVAGQRGGVIDQVTHDGIAGRRQKAAPGDLEVLERLPVAAPGVGAGTGLQVPLDLVAHRRTSP